MIASPKPRQPAPDGAPAAAPLSINYSTTRTVPVNHEHLRRACLVTDLAPCPFVDAFKILRTRVLQRLREHHWNAFAVTGPTPRGGTSLVAANLALALALEATQTVLLVDANLQTPGLHGLFGLESRPGLSDHLLDGVPLEDVLLHPEGIERFVLLPGGRPLSGSAELLTAPTMIRLVSELKQRYKDRIVVFDLPPLRTADAVAFAPLADALLLVASAGRTGQEDLRQALTHLRGLPILGIAFNGTEPPPTD